MLALDTRPAVHDPDSFEQAVEVVASLGVRLRRDRAPLEVVTTGGSLLARPGPGAIELLLDRLAVVEPSPEDHLAAVIASLRARLGIGTVVVATGAPDAAFVEAVTRLSERCVVTVVATRHAEHTLAAPPDQLGRLRHRRLPRPVERGVRSRTRASRRSAVTARSTWTSAASP